MKIKAIETVETILELPDNHFDNKDYDEENLADCELIHEFKTHGKKLWESWVHDDISWDTREVGE